MTALDLKELKQVIQSLVELYERLDLLTVELEQPKPNVEQLQAHMVNVQASQNKLSEAIRPIAQRMNRMVTNM